MKNFEDDFLPELEKFSSQEQDLSSTEKDIREFLHLDHLNEDEKQHVIKLAEHNRKNVYLPGDQLPRTAVVTHRIPTTDDNPIYSKQYRFPHTLKEEINRQVQESCVFGSPKTALTDQGTASELY